MAVTVGSRAKVLGVALSLVAGLSIAAQARINGQLAAETGDAVLAALVSFGGGLILLLVLLVALPGMRTGIAKVRAALRGGSLRKWYLLGGLGGATLIASQATVGALGVAVYTVGVVAGQTASGLVVDRAGLGPAGKRPLSVVRLLGAALMIGAVLVTMSNGIGTSGGDRWLLVFPIIGGLAVAVQQAINGRVGAAAGNPMTATLVNFVVGTTALMGLASIVLAVRGVPDGLPSSPVLYLGGPIGVGVIATGALVVRWIGVLVLGLAMIAGQLVGAMLLDAFLPAHPAGLTVTTVSGVALAFVAIAVATSGPLLTRRFRT